MQSKASDAAFHIKSRRVNVKCCDRPSGNRAEIGIIVKLQTFHENGLGKFVSSSVLVALDSGASIFLPLQCRFTTTVSIGGCKDLSRQLSKISRMASRSAKSVFDFFRLDFSWFNNSAASGKSLLAAAEFFLRSESSASIFFRSSLSFANCSVRF